MLEYPITLKDIISLKLLIFKKKTIPENKTTNGKRVNKKFGIFKKVMRIK
jgi:hypothetical protein